MSSCEDIFGRKLACLRRQTSGPSNQTSLSPPQPVPERGRNKRRGLPPALISIGRFWQEMQICTQIGTHPKDSGDCII